MLKLVRVRLSKDVPDYSFAFGNPMQIQLDSGGYNEWHKNNIIPMIFDEAFIVKWLPKSGDNRTTKAAEYYEKCLS